MASLNPLIINNFGKQRKTQGSSEMSSVVCSNEWTVVTPGGKLINFGFEQSFRYGRSKRLHMKIFIHIVLYATPLMQG
jgi:hypothetical protein